MFIKFGNKIYINYLSLCLVQYTETLMNTNYYYIIVVVNIFSCYK